MDERTWGPLLGVAALVVIVSPMAWVAIKGRKWLVERAHRYLQDFFSRFGAISEQREGYVPIRFPIYVGALVTVQELTACAWVPRENGRAAVNSLAFYSITHGLITIFAPYVLFMVFLNYVLHLPRLAGR